MNHHTVLFSMLEFSAGLFAILFVISVFVGFWMWLAGGKGRE